MKRAILAVFAGAAMLLPGLGFSAQAKNLYETEVPVLSQGTEARHAGLVAAMEEVLIKLSGTGEVLQSPALAEVLQTPEPYVDQFRFVAAPQGAVEGQQRLWVRFDGRALEQLLRSKGVPVWGANRPLVVVWLAQDDRGRRTLLGAADKGGAVAAVEAAADRRGVPVHVPNMDGEDRARIRPGDIWGDAGGTLNAASLRYHPQAVVTGALTKESSVQWRGHWVLYRDGVALQYWDTFGPLALTVDTGIDLISDQLARAFAVSDGGSAEGGPLTLRVDGVRSVEDFTRLNNYLRGLGGVSAVQPAEVTADRVVLNIAFQGSAQRLVRALALTNMLVPVEDPMAPETQLNYRLRK